MIQQWNLSLNKQVHCYVAKLFPSGITWTIKCVHADGLLYADDDLIKSKTYGFYSL